MSLLSDLHKTAFAVLQTADPVTFTFDGEDYEGVLNAGARLSKTQMPEGYDAEQLSTLFVAHAQMIFDGGDIHAELTIDGEALTIVGVTPYGDKTELLLARHQ